MKTHIIAAAALLMTVPALADPGVPGDRANTNSGAAYESQAHSTPAVRAANGDKNLASQDGTSMQGGVSASGATTTQSQAMGAAPGGQTGGTKSTGP